MAKKEVKNVTQKVEQMKAFINSYQDEYDQKKSELSSLEEELKNLQNNVDEFKIKYKQEVLDECEAKINSANEMLSQANKDREDASNLQIKAQDLYDKKINEITKQKNAFEKDKKAQKDEVDNYVKTKHSEVEQYVEDHTKEVKDREKNVSKIEKDLKSREEDILKIEQQQAGLQNELDKRKNEAELGFQVELRSERLEFNKELAKVKEDIANLGEKLIEGQKAVDDEIANYKSEKLDELMKGIQKEKEKVQNEYKQLLKQKEELEKQTAEIETEKIAINIKKDAYEQKYGEIDNIANTRLQELYKDVIADRDNFKNHCNEMQKQLNEKNQKVIELKSKINNSNGINITVLQKENNELKSKLEKINSEENSLINKLRSYNIDSATLVKQLFKIEQYDTLMDSIQQLNSENQMLNLKVRDSIKDQEALELEKKRSNNYLMSLEDAISELERYKQPKREDRLSSFTPYEEFNQIANLDAYGSNLSEINWLQNIKSKMESSEIKISNRLLYAFHTSLKIHDWSPIVVLAGVSGTGKSELPRQYAHHGGMNFISIPVKPDWDSMQSLFGYYNSIENKFEPTELSRAIFHMKSSQMDNTMLLVLLDEMNLAYVELYFSDLLSKFETNRGTDDVITYDISLGANEEPEKMIIGDNILWVGTMNEDETTKALSDKVIDRSTLVTFPRPTTLVSRRSDIKIPATEKRLTQNLWNKWCNNTLTEEIVVNNNININEYRDIIQDINSKMSQVNRNLGHRVWQSIERYVFSHPLVVANVGIESEFKKCFHAAFEEAIAFKIMPKLRGIEVSGASKKVLEAIGHIIEDKVPDLKEDYDHAMGLSTKIFQWCSAMFMEDKEN